MSKGAHATTAIEGNTLTEDEVSRMLDGPLGLPPSRRYLEQEVRNVLDAYEIIGDRVRTGKDLTLTPEIICSYNELVLRDVEWDDRIRPGRIRKYEVTVGRYRGPPAQDCAHLLNRRYDWLACSDFEAREDDPLAFTRVLTQGLLAHLYIAWIHPFGNGNGRTARLVEFHLLAGSGMVPTPAVHLLSNYYNQTRGPLLPGTGSVEPDTAVVAGRVHRLCTRWVRGRSREQSDWIKAQHLALAWQSYVDEAMRRHDTAAGRRQRQLVLSLSPSDPTPRSEITLLTPHLAAAYAGKTSKTVTRDISRLVALGLIERTPQGIRPLVEKMEAFMASSGGVIR